MPVDILSSNYRGEIILSPIHTKGKKTMLISQCHISMLSSLAQIERALIEDPRISETIAQREKAAEGNDHAAVVIDHGYDRAPWLQILNWYGYHAYPEGDGEWDIYISGPEDDAARPDVWFSPLAPHMKDGSFIEVVTSEDYEIYRLYSIKGEMVKISPIWEVK
jgi:hypothetical protein